MAKKKAVTKKKATKKKATKKKATVKANPVGRPTRYDPKYCELLIKTMGEEGLSYEAFAGVIGVCKQTLYSWEKEYKEFLDAKRLAVAAGQVFWERIGVENIVNKTDSESWGVGMGSSKSRSLNASAWIFNMKNRFQWRDKQPDEDQMNVTINLGDKVAKARARLNKVKK